MNIGKTYYFGNGKKKAANVVTEVTMLENNSQYQAQVTLRGPRGGEYLAFVRRDGSVGKV